MGCQGKSQFPQVSDRTMQSRKLLEAPQYKQEEKNKPLRTENKDLFLNSRKIKRKIKKSVSFRRSEYSVSNYLALIFILIKSSI